uniref:Kinetochore-associated protein 1-like n=1 Tax=Saccoglossus kowalevskii TaxID=10224 RepID=A0ABM0M2Q1_SACKO|nr:PREDICTED: kinetochore-associated protein 1-like [Saccoglossus kowalevskii]
MSYMIGCFSKATEQESYSKATEVYSVTKVEKQTEEAGVKESIQMECINTSEVHTESNNNAVICDNTLDMNLVTIGKGDSCVTVWQEENNTMQPYMLSAHMMPDQGYLKCKISHDNKFIFLLDNQNNLSMLDFKSLVTCAYWSTIKVQDFILMTVGSVQTMDKDGDLGYGFRVIVLTVPNPECYLQVYSLPGMKLTYSLEVGCHSALVDAPLSQDTIFLIEGVRSDDDFDNDNGLVATLRVRCLTEALPDTRFHRLLHKKRFEEAIQFAQQFGQDVQLVYKVKSCHINDLVAPWSNQSDDVDIAQLFVSYKDCMEHIQDIEYVTESCTNTDFPNYSCIVDLLNYARFRVNGSSKNSNNSKTTELMAMIMKVQHRLDTYNMTYGVKNFSGPKWSQFLDADLLTECIDMLSKGQIGTAATIWKRHQCEFEDNFTEKVLENILSSIPENIKSEDIIPWLDNEIIPFVIEVLPSAQNLLALWLIKKARDMELSEKDDWPNNALEMAQLLFKSGRSIEHSEQGRKITTPSEFSTLICNHSVTCMNNTKQNTSITLLQKLIQNLKDLINLHKEYKCKLTLAEFSKETTSTITFRMLDRVVAPELIPQSITKVVRPYMKQHNLAEEELLFHYIKDLTDRCGNISSYAYESSWEAKAVAVIHCIKDLDYFYQAILSMMLKVTVPWSDLVENLVRKGLSFDHPRVEQLKQVHEFVKLRTIILKYDLYNFNISSETMAPYLLKYFLTKDLPCAMEDALQVVKVYPNIVKPDDVYMFRLRFLVQQERIPECIDLLKVIPKADCIKCANRLLIYCLTVLNAEEEETDEYLECQHEEKVTFTETGIAVIQFLIKIEEEPAIQGDLQTLLTQLKCILSLQRQYSIFLTLDTYRNPTLRDEILTSYLVDFFSGKNSHTMSKVASGDKKPAKTQNTGYNRIYRLAELLQTSSNDLRGQLAIEAARNGQIETAIKMSNELYELVPDAKTSQVLYAVAYYLCKLQSDDSKTDKWFSHEIYQLACHAALLCHTDMLCDCMELCKCTRLTDQIFQQCESGDYGVTVQSTASNIPGFQRDPYIEWTYNDFFKEDGLVLDSSIAIPLSNLFNMCCIPRIRPVVDRLPYEHDRLIGQSINDLSDQESQPHLMDLSHIAWEMVSLLQENSLYSLGMAYILKTISEFVLYSTSRNMGFSDAISSQAMDSIMAQLKSKGNVMVQEHTSNLLLKIFGSRKVDISLALGYACILTKEKALDKLKSISTSAGYNYNKVTAVSKVSEELALLYNDSDLVSHCKKMATKSSWGSRLSQLQILFQEAFNTDRTVNYQNLLPQIIEHKNVNIDMLKDYCRDFGLNIDEALWLYLETLLLSDKHMDYGNTSETPLDETLIRSVILQVVNLDTLKCKLEDILDRVNYYDYDRITLILKLMQEFCPLQKTELDNQIMKGMKLFEYLYAYQRVSKPSTYEATFRYKTEEDQLLHGSHPLPELSKTRLPYHPLIHGKPWKIISPELNANTVSSLLPIAEVLKLQGDNMYIVAVQNIVNEVKKQWQLQESLETGSTNVSWNTSRRMNVKTLESFNNLLMKISDRKMAVATCRWIAQEIPRGPDQVLMLKLCCVLAHSWKEISQNDPATLDMATTTLAKFTELHKTLSTEQVLRKYHLTDVTYLRLTNQPARLIFTLYEHKSIEKSFAGSLESLPDIHSAADEISAVNAYNISKIRMTLLENWLPSQHYKKDHMDETAGFNWKSNEISDDERNLRRYILKFSISGISGCLYL